MATFDWSVIPMLLVKQKSAPDSEWVFEMRHKRWTARIAWDAADRALSRTLPELHKALWVGRVLLHAPQGVPPRYQLGESPEDSVRTAMRISYDNIYPLRRALGMGCPELVGGRMTFLTRFMLFARVYHDKYYREEESHSGLEEAASLVVPWAAPITEALYTGAVREFPWLESAESRRQAEAHKDAVLRVYEELAMEAMAPKGIYPDLTEELCLSPRPCGQGASCDVYLARWNSRNGEIQVAVKVFRITDDAPNESAAKLSMGVKDELDIWSRLKHPHILPLCGMHWIGGIPGLVSPWCANGDITKYVRDLYGPAKHAIALNLVRVVRYLTMESEWTRSWSKWHLASIIVREHARSSILCPHPEPVHSHRPVVVHGDSAKQANILISDDGRALLCDFGLAAVEAAVAETSPVLLPWTTAKGTYRWMAHELVIYDDAQLTRESDVWAFGCVLVEVLGGRVPFYEKTEAVQVILAISRGEIPSRPRGLHDRLWKLMLQCWRLVPSARPSAGNILEDIRSFWGSDELERWMSGQLTDASPV